MSVVADTTTPVSWALVGVVALALLVAMLIRRIRGMLWALVGTGRFGTAQNSVGRPDQANSRRRLASSSGRLLAIMWFVRISR